MLSRPPRLRRSGIPTSRATYLRYESDSALAQYCEAHYGPDRFGVRNFSLSLVEHCASVCAESPKRRALDLGCAVGRSSFELARYFEQVSAVDLSSRFIALAQRLQKRGKLSYRRPEEGDIVSDQKIVLADYGLAVTAGRVEFSRGNVQDLDGHYCQYDLILAANLIDRLPAPGRFLSKIHRRMVVGGVLAIASPYAWREEYTPRRQWLGGHFRAGRPRSGQEGLSLKLAKHFEPIGPPREIEYILRDTARTYQHGISQLTCWRRVD